NGVLKINTEKCTKCRMCMRLGCPAIVDRGTHVEVDPALCTGCDLCTKVCRFNAFERLGGENA
ncbi:MAG TPA: 4Fe-4S binding protein, partial [Thermoclostridium sp.]|nr:4Fe-4S binding protein [Thermoclostridium sp.]